MASPLAHGLIGFSIGLMSGQMHTLPRCGTLTRQALACAALACLPDIDILFSWLATGSFTALHFKFTHTLFFALACGVAVWPWATSKTVLLVFALVASHCVVDGLTGPVLGLSHTVGIALLAPFSDTVFVSPVTVFRGIQHAKWFSAANFNTVILELVWSLPALLMLRRRLSRFPVQGIPSPAAL